MTTDASRKAVFNTSELLEQIILCLPVKNIFGIQRVCKQFRDVIAGSPKIQEKMFLRLRNDVPKEAWVLETSVSTLVPWGEEPYLRKVDVNTGKRHYRPVALNPLLGLMSAEQRLSAADRLYRNEDQTEYAEMFLSRNHFGAHPSFLKTYITDPPCYTAQASITADFLLDPTDEDAFRGTVFGEEVTAKGGLTIGDLILARTSVELFWDTLGLGDAEYGDSQMEEVIDYTAPFVTGNTSGPRVQLQLQEVVIPTDEERRAVSSQHEKAAS
jgi:hypothetical protein